MKDKIIAKQKEAEKKLKEPNNKIDSYRCYWEGRLSLANELLAELEQEPTAMEQVREAFEPIQLDKEQKIQNILNISHEITKSLYSKKQFLSCFGNTEVALQGLLIKHFIEQDKEHSEKLGEKYSHKCIKCNYLFRNDKIYHSERDVICQKCKSIERQPNKEAEEIPSIKMLENMIEDKWGQPTGSEYIQTETRHNLAVWLYELFTRLKLQAYSKKSRRKIIEDWMKWYYESEIDNYTKKYIKQYLNP